MELIGRRLAADELRAVPDDPASVDTLLYGDLDDPDAEMPEPELDLDKSWHGIHYLLTGTAWEIGEGAGAAILGGDEIGTDGSYGPARLVRPDAVRAVAAALDAVDVETSRARFDPAAMTAADIYPSLREIAPLLSHRSGTRRGRATRHRLTVPAAVYFRPGSPVTRRAFQRPDGGRSGCQGQ